MTSEGAGPEVLGKVGGVVELECSFPPSEPAAVSSASLHVVEWVRQGLDIPVLIKFGSYAPRLHPQYEGEHHIITSSWANDIIQLKIVMLSHASILFSMIAIIVCHCLKLHIACSACRPKVYLMLYSTWLDNIYYDHTFVGYFVTHSLTCLLSLLLVYTCTSLLILSANSMVS